MDTDAAAIARERAALRVEHDRLEAQFAAELARCSERFAVNACRDDVNERRRAALEGPRVRSLALDDLERSRRAVARREALARKQRGASAPPVAAESVPSAPPTAPSSAAATAPRAPQEAPSHGMPRQASVAAASAAADAAAAQRAAESRRRQASIRAERERVQARQAERARQGKTAAPLPVPAASRAGAR